MNLNEKLTTVIMTAGQVKDTELTIEALGAVPGKKFIISNGAFSSDKARRVGWTVLELNDNYGIGAALNMSFRLSSDYLLLLEDDWSLNPKLLKNTGASWIEELVQQMESNNLDIIRMRQHYDPIDARMYGTFDWNCQGQPLAEKMLGGKFSLSLRDPGDWYVQNTPQIWRTAKIKAMAPFVEYKNGAYRDAWLKYGYAKEEVALTEFNQRDETKQLRVGVLYPGLFVHELNLKIDKPKVMPCDNCCYGFSDTLEYRGVNWCTTCDRKIKNFWNNDSIFLGKAGAVDQDLAPVHKAKNDVSAGMALVKVLVFGMERGVAEVFPFSMKVGSVERVREDLAQFNPDVILTFGSKYDARLNDLEVTWRAKWAHAATLEDVIPRVSSCYALNLYRQPLAPLASVYTGAHESGKLIQEAYDSLAAQTYTNWEWVVVVDVKHDETDVILDSLTKLDPRVKVYRIPYTGKIGAVKDAATRLCSGPYLIELDHDDLLLPTAVEDVVKAFEDDKLLGFVYSDCAEITFDGQHVTYEFDDYWKTRYRNEEFNGKVYRPSDSFDIYDGWGNNHWEKHAWFLTVGPNHVRAFRQSELIRLGGYNPNLRVTDDWDLMARFYLYSSCRHLKKFLYIQRFSANNTQRKYTWNQLIQHNLVQGREHYNSEFERFVAQSAWAPAKPIKFPDSRPKLLTIVIATYGASYQRISSLLGQVNHPAVSVKVVSDGHDYKCEAYVKETAARLENDDMQYLFIPPTPKPAWGHAQRKYAIANCTTPYLWFVDDDNAVYAGAVDKIIAALEDASPDILFVDLDYPGHLVNLPHLTEIVLRTVDDVKYQHVDTMSLVVRKELAQWEDVNYTGDWTYINQCKEKAERISFLGEKVGRYRAGA